MCKVVIIGDTRAGKTSLRKNWFGEKLNTSEYIMTLGADFAIKKLDNAVVQVWDLSGQISYRSIRKSYYQGLTGVILAFDLTEKSSFDNLEFWMDEINDYATRNVPIYIVANKLDLHKEDDPIITDEEIIKKLAALSDLHNNDFNLIKTSALTGENVEFLFTSLINSILNRT